MKKVRVRKFNFLKFTVFLLFLYVLYFIISAMLKVPIKHIIVKGTHFLSDEEVIEVAKIESYPSFFKTMSNTIEKRISTLDLTQDVKVRKKWGFVVEINITEEKIVFIERSTGKYVLENHTEKDLSGVEGIPTLINYVVDSVKEKLITKLSEVDYDVLTKVSEIEYSPTSYDEERFILYMNDGNTVYITLNKIDEFKKYIEIKKQLGGNNGILYLDSGNYFEIKE